MIELCSELTPTVPPQPRSHSWLAHFAVLAGMAFLVSGCTPDGLAVPSSAQVVPTSSAASATTSPSIDIGASVAARALRYFQIGISVSIDELDGSEFVPASEVMERPSYPQFLVGAVEFLDDRVASEGVCGNPVYLSFNTNWEASYKAYYVCAEAEAVTVYNTVASANRDAQQAGYELTGSVWNLPDGWWTIDGDLCPTEITGLDQLLESPSEPYEVHWGGASYCLTMLWASRANSTTKPDPGQEKAYLADKYRKMLRDLVQTVSVKPSEWDRVRELLV